MKKLLHATKKEDTTSLMAMVSSIFLNEKGLSHFGKDLLRLEADLLQSEADLLQSEADLLRSEADLLRRKSPLVLFPT